MEGTVSPLRLVVLLAAVLRAACDYPFRNTSLPWADRVDDLVFRLTLDEAINQMAKSMPAPAIERLGIKPYDWDTECLRGDVQSGPATSFPQALGLAATFRKRSNVENGNVVCMVYLSANVNPIPEGPFAQHSTEDLVDHIWFHKECPLSAPLLQMDEELREEFMTPSIIFRVAEATAVEVRAKYNNYTAHGIYAFHKGISCFSPVINIMRHPLWGRNQETYGEDPFMNGLYAQHFVAGLQGNHPRYVRASAGCKHFDVHGGPENIPVQRASFDSEVAIRDWRLTFLPAFRMCVEAGTYSVMCSYNSINGIPSCANKELLTDILRGEWGFTGYVVSDQGAIENILYAHHYTNNTADTVAVAVNAGCNLELSGHQDRDIYMNMTLAVDAGTLPMDTIRERLKPLFYTRMRLGEFDPPETNPYTNLNISVVESESHVTLAREAAVQSFVLLKNKIQFLPLKYPGMYKNVAMSLNPWIINELTSQKIPVFHTAKNTSNGAVIGPMANDMQQIFGDYNPESEAKYIVTPYLGLKSIWPNAGLATGCSSTACTDYNMTSISNAVRGADIVFICLGTGQALESEGNDRADMNLPGSQLQLLQDAVNIISATNIPVVVMMFNAGPLDISWADENDDVLSIIECFFPAQETGNALQQVLLGEESPAGRLPYTWYRSVNQTPPITNYTMYERTYRYFTGDPLYPFGYGLSYSTFSYTDLTVGSPSLEAGQDQTVSVTLHNSGQVVSDEVVQVYISWVSPSTPMPQLQLVAYDRLRALSPVETAVTVKFVIQSHQMAQWDDTKQEFFVQPGTINVYAGGQQPNQKRSVGSNVLQGSFQINGQKYLGKF